MKSVALPPQETWTAEQLAAHAVGSTTAALEALERSLGAVPSTGAREAVRREYAGCEDWFDAGYHAIASIERGGDL